MQKMHLFLVKFASLRVSVCLLVAFLLLTFWGVMAQATAESAGVPVAEAADRFFGSYFIWALGYVPLPAFKSLAALSVLHLIASIVYRIPRGWKNAGLVGMHVALIVLLLGSLAGSGLKQEFNGFAVTEAPSDNVIPKDLKFFSASDSLGDSLVRLPVLSDESGVGMSAAWPYYVQYRGYVEMAPDKNVAMYRAVYDPFHCTPYVFMALFFLSAMFHYGAKVRYGRGSLKKCDGSPSQDAKNPADTCKPLAVLVLCCGMAAVTPANAMPGDVREAHSQEVESLLSNPATAVMFNGEIRSFDAFARGVLDDFCGKVRYKCAEGEAENCPRKMPASEVVRNMIVFPEKTAKYKFFKVLRSDVAEALRLPQDARYVSYEEIAPSRGELEIYASRKDNHPATAEMKRLYGNVRLYETITNYETFRNMAGLVPFADSSEVELVVTRATGNADVNGTKLSLEVFYHKANFCLWAFAFAFAGCLLAAVNLVVNKRKLDVVSNALGMAATAILFALFTLRLYITGRVPLANLYEIILMVVLLLEGFEVGAFFFCKKRSFTLMVPIAFMSALLLFFAKFILETGDTFQAIPAVLNSSVFLTIHVFTIAIGFAAMILSGVIAHLHLFRLGRSSSLAPHTSNIAPCTTNTAQPSSLAPLLYATLVFGGVFTILGTLLGGVWADYAWGRFWGFDPKECGALFVCLWAMLALHLRAGRLVSERGFALFNCFNVIVTFLCWFGINLLGVGLHSYGFQNGTAMWLLGFVAADLVLIGTLWKKLTKNRCFL